ncbi:MAG: colicin import membrane protein [Gammaproteobacteria bacterium]|jgi:colicin import membrane protein
MDVDWKYVSAFFLSVILHGLVIGLLVFSVDTSVKRAPKPVPHVNIVKAVSVDNSQVEKELKRLKDVEKEKFDKELKKQKELENKLKDLNQKTASAAKQRKAEEEKLAELKKKKNVEQKKREEEEKKIVQLKKEKAEIEKKQKENDELKRKEEADKKAQEELKLKKEQELKRKQEQEKRLQEEMAEEQRQQEAAQLSRDQQLLHNIVGSIKRSIVSNFNTSGLPTGLECVLSVRLVPGGEVVSVTIRKSSGNDIFDRRALVAVQKASPLPIPEDVATFERLKLRQLAFPFRLNQ